MAYDHIVLDVEIQKTIEELPNGWSDTHLMGISCAVIYEFLTDRFRVYGDTPEELQTLQKRILVADRVTGFNTWSFDFPVIWKVSREVWRGDREIFELTATLVALKSRLRETSDDLLRRIWQANGLDPDVFTDAHKGWGLDQMCLGTLGVGKTGHGAEAPKLYQRGQWGPLVDYNLMDVKLTRDLCRFMDRYGYVVHPSHGKLTVPPWEGQT